MIGLNLGIFVIHPKKGVYSWDKKMNRYARFRNE